MTFDHIRSIGLKSGLYGGRKRTAIPACSSNRVTRGILCAERLSITTMLPDGIAATSICSTYASNDAPSIGPSSTNGAMTRSALIAATSVVVCQCPCGA